MVFSTASGKMTRKLETKKIEGSLGKKVWNPKVDVEELKSCGPTAQDLCSVVASIGAELQMKAL